MDQGNFIVDYVAFNQGTEVPETFAFWCGIAGISAALGRRVYLQFGLNRIYPNMMVVLVASSGKHRKSTAINVIEDMLRQITPMPNLISQKITPEALIEAMEVSRATKNDLTAVQHQGIVIADELAVFLNKSSYEAGLGSLLIQLYDCKKHFSYRTKGRGLEELSDTSFGLLAGSTVDWLRNAIPEDSVGGGLTSRMVFVYVEDPAKPIAFPEFTAEKRQLLERLVSSLQWIGGLEGEIKLSPEAKRLLERDYEEFYLKSPLYDIKSLSGYASRRQMHLLKVAMTLAISAGSWVIEERHADAARQALIKCELYMPHVLNLVTSTQQGSDTAIVLELIRRATKDPTRRRLDRSLLLRFVSNRLNSRELTDAVETLIHSRQVRTISNGATIYYEYIGD